MISDEHKCNISLIIIITGSIIFFLFILPWIDNNYKENFEAYFNKDLVKIDTNRCSRDCCGLTQWPVPAEMLVNYTDNKFMNNIPPNELENYIPSNFSCNFGDNVGSGCVCITKDDYTYLNNHGQPN